MLKVMAYGVKIVQGMVGKTVKVYLISNKADDTFHAGGLHDVRRAPVVETIVDGVAINHQHYTRAASVQSLNKQRS